MKIFHSKKGFLSAEKNGKNIHSLYNPQREAERFIKASINKKPSLVVVLGAGLGYILEQLNIHYPDTVILAIYYDETLFENVFYKSETIYCWHPSSGITISSFFNSYIKEESLKGIEIIEWNPTSLIYPEKSLYINQELKKVVQQLNGNIKTTAVFGKKWMRNMICNYLSIDTYFSYPVEKSPIVIASSGPTLEKNLKELKKYRNKYRLWALPSSIKLLQLNSIKADMLITTDPGYYGSYHLQNINEFLPVALPFTASRGLWKKNNPAFILNQDFPFEKDLFTMANIKKTDVPSNGTVSGTAFEIALLNSDYIFFAGLDLCYSDIQSHAKPHSFDSLLSAETLRINPLHSIFFNRAAPATADFQNRTRTSRSLDTYKNWFNYKSTNPVKKIKRLNPSPIEIDNIKKGSLKELDNFPDLKPFDLFFKKAEDKTKRIEVINILLNNWEKGLLNGTRNDLFYFINTESFSNGEKSTVAIEFITRLRGIYGK